MSETITSGLHNGNGVHVQGWEAQGAVVFMQPRLSRPSHVSTAASAIFASTGTENQH